MRRKNASQTIYTVQIAPYISLLLAANFAITASSATTSTRIVGGTDISIHDAPWQVSVQISARHECGGVIYTKEMVITTAHCVVGISPTVMQIRVGAEQYYTGGSLISVRRFMVHEEYDPIRYDNDIAIIHLSKPLNFNETVNCINLASSSPSHDLNAYITGWGFTDENGINGYSRNLQVAHVKIISREECASNNYGYGWDFVTNSMICAAGSGKDACRGDSGGALVVNYLLVGIASWGIGCGLKNYPGVYVDIASLHSWILEVQKEL